MPEITLWKMQMTAWKVVNAGYTGRSLYFTGGNSVKKCFVLILGVCLLIFTQTFVFAGGQQEGKAEEMPEDVVQWLRENKIGPYQEETVDYDALYQAALKEEGPVVVYASSSRGPKSLAKGFYEKYPGIEVEWNTIGTSEGIERLISEQSSGIYNNDILFVSDFPVQVNVLNAANMLFPWVPPELRSVIPENFQKPLLAHRYEARVLFYNDSAYKNAPVESWWDLTRPEWSRNLVLEDPRVSASSLDFFTTIVLNADEMAEEYKRVFGKPIELTTENAGYEFIKMIAENKPQLIERDSKGRFIAEPGQTNPPLGMCFAFSRIRDAGKPDHGNLTWAVATNLKPKAGLLYPSGINIAYKAPHPNSAKLVVRWLLGDEKGGSGMSPWFVPGNWPSRIDVTETPQHPYLEGHSWPVTDLEWWNMDAEKLFQEKTKVLEFIQEHF